MDSSISIISRHRGQIGYFSGSRFGIHFLPHSAVAAVPSTALFMIWSFFT